MRETNSKVTLSGVPETMLQTVYARAKETQNRGAVRDEKAVEIIRRLDYDFSLADKDSAMSSGVIARTIVLDKLVKTYLSAHPGSVAVNIACGLDPKKNIMFIQSHVPQHAELSWVLGCYTQFGELSRMTQFKMKSQQHADNITAGLFTYPVLMAADILLYQSDLVPVGEDQRQHVELCRDIAARFNNSFPDTFTLPEAFIPKMGARVMSLGDPTSKMSKSDPDGCVYMMDKPEDIMRKFKRAVTDCDACVKFDKENKPGISNLLSIYCAATGKTVAEAEAAFAGQGYGIFKPAVAESVIELLRPIREEAERLTADKA